RRTMTTLETADIAPTPAMQAAYGAACKDLGTAMATWRGISAPGGPVAKFNAVLEQNKLKPVAAPTAGLAAPQCGA
ncbi:MAG TPA: hypothetical protein VG454_00490, partial [Gemmatimonadales bacterium]|nr:hypothetical protein [Gemmatimonadales bacterium]